MRCVAVMRSLSSLRLNVRIPQNPRYLTIVSHFSTLPHTRMLGSANKDGLARLNETRHVHPRRCREVIRHSLTTDPARTQRTPTELATQPILRIRTPLPLCLEPKAWHMAMKSNEPPCSRPNG